MTVGDVITKPEEICSKLIELVPPDREVVFACVGTDRSTGDAFGPLVGARLQESGFDVIGTVENPMHGWNIDECLKALREAHPDRFVIGIDACLGTATHVGWINVENCPLRPGAGVNKQLSEVGDIHLAGVVNVAGFMEYFVLQNTRLALVLQMVENAVKGIQQFMETRSAMRLVAATV